jgi:hypothetical protein
MTWEVAEGQIQKRVHSKDLFKDKSFKRVALPDEVTLVRGQLKSNKEWATQSVRFPKDRFTLEQAQAWFKDRKLDRWWWQ